MRTGGVVALGILSAAAAGCGDGDGEGPVACRGVALGAGSAGGDITPEPGCTGASVDPVGAWLINVQWLGGDCGLTGQSQIAVDVARAGEGYTVYPITPPGTIDGPVSVSCTPQHCAVDAAILENGARARWTFSLYSDLDRVISGDGELQRYAQDLSEAPCTQQWRATGTIE